MDRKLFFTLLTSVVLAFLLYVLFLVFQPFLSAMIWAAILVTLTYPVYKRLLNKWPHKPEVIAGLMCLGLTLLLVLPATFLGIILVKDLNEGVVKLSGTLQTLDYNSWLKFEHPFFQQKWVKQGVDFASNYVDLKSLDIRGTIVNGVQNLSSFFLESSKGFFAAFSGFLFLLVMIEINMFFFFRDGKSYMNYFKSLIPIDSEQKDLVLGRMQEVIRASIFGSVGTAVAQGVIGGAAFVALGVPSAILWSVIMLFMSFLPMAGPFVVWVPVAIYLLTQGFWIKALILTLWGTLVVGTVDNVIRPLLIRKVSSEGNQLNTLVLFIAVLGGIKVFGFLGIVLAPLLVVMVITLLELMTAALGHQEGKRMFLHTADGQQALQNTQAVNPEPPKETE
jgi:predicted PurR-regulated permease PerM